MKTTTHWYLPMQDHENWLKDWIEKGLLNNMQHHDPNSWRSQVLGQCKSWIDGGLQERAMTRDLDWGVKVPGEATEGKVNAHVIKAVSGHEKDGSGLHFHNLDFQMVYILKGWVIFKYENEGEFKLKEGDCVHQIPGIKHEEIEHSVDLEMLEITMPADFETKMCD